MMQVLCCRIGLLLPFSAHVFPFDVWFDFDILAVILAGWESSWCWSSLCWLESSWCKFHSDWVLIPFKLCILKWSLRTLYCGTYHDLCSVVFMFFCFLTHLNLTFSFTKIYHEVLWFIWICFTFISDLLMLLFACLIAVTSLLGKLDHLFISLRVTVLLSFAYRWLKIFGVFPFIISVEIWPI